MSRHSRYAVYYMPSPGPLARFGAAWLGWDALTGCEVPHLPVPGLPDLTQTPRKYGFHGTLKPPFRLVEGQSPARLARAVKDLAAATAPARAGNGLTLTRMGRFFALTPQGDAGSIARVAAACVEELDPFRAPASDAELARRRNGLTDRQEALLLQWGYPFVMDQFHFHLTLTGAVPKACQQEVWAQIESQLPDLSGPFDLRDLCLAGERADGRFELLHRYPLLG